VFEAAGAEEHEGEEHEVVAGVDDGAGGQGTCGETDPAEDEADKDQKEEWAERPGGLEAVHQSEREAGDHGADDHCGEGPVWFSVIVILYFLCRAYDRYKTNNPQKWWLSYL